MINEEYLVKECKAYIELTNRFADSYDIETSPYNHGFFVGANYMLETILNIIKREQKYEDNQQFCDNDHDSIMKYDKQKHEGWYYAKEQRRK